MCVNSVHFCHLVYSMFSQKFIFIFIFEYPLRIISELIKILVDTLIKYYTDWYDVDEDSMTVAKCGASSDWTFGIQAGVTSRTIYSTPTDSGPNVASVCRHLKYSLNYTDGHDVDEDMPTIVRHGGWYVDGYMSGVACRFMRETPTNTSESVASSNMKN